VVVLLTAIVNLSAMVATGFATGLEQALFGREGLSFDLLWKLLVLLTVFAMFFSAVILTLTSVARSFKEAQAYLIPLMLMSMAPGVLAMFPGMEMTPLWAITPLANIVLLTRDLFDNRASAGLAAITLIATAGYAGVALAAAARVFGTDAVLYGSSSTWTDLLRRPAESRRSPDWTQGLIALGGLFPAYVLLGGIPARLTDWSLSSRLGASAIITVLLFAVWPSALAYLRRIDWRGAFRWHAPAALAVAGAVCWGLSLWPFVYELELRTLSTERVAALTELFRSLEAELRAIPLAWKLCALAVVPAACEELFFRGFLFQAIRSATGPWVTILLTAGLFGLFHVLVRDALLLERLLPTALMGIALGWVCHRTGSVLPGMLLHVLHNGSLLSVDRWFPALNSQATAETTTGGVGLPVLAGAAAIAVTGWLCFWFARKGNGSVGAGACRPGLVQRRGENRSDTSRL
jgi:sodium transport system permease protein